ncbi:acetoin utilization protein acuB [Robiginitalea sp. SC105]|uniref:acetoin utilization protein acuB n=1 Tax=Robiginitalea sp. SC105 TaxID=2762332 RepID=UPI00163961F4|nr:acetoin utilization protein acuB [Robiginitalea sp. SC105]MBC2838902.1 acetoin utilization protein acuB [Robiginitalea sp. SC105]
MQIQEHIISTIPVFEVTDTLKEAIHFFTHSTYSHVAITEKGVFLGLLGEADLDSFEEMSPIEDFRYQLESFHVNVDAGWIDILEVFTRNEANLLPVIGPEGKLLGYYDLNDVVGIFTHMPFFTEPGAILVVSKPLKDYSFSEIAQIVEGNNTRLLGAFITEIKNDLVQITLKMGDTNINEVIQTFRRYKYTILTGSADDAFLDALRQRSDYLDKYLNV